MVRQAGFDTPEKALLRKKCHEEGTPPLLIADDHTIFAKTLKVLLEQIYPEAGLSPLLLLTVVCPHHLSYRAIALRAANEDLMFRILSEDMGQAGSDAPQRT